MGIIIATLIVLTVIASVLAQDYSIFSWGYWQERGTSTSRSEVFRNFGLAFIALGALVVGSWRAVLGYMQAQASQQQAAAANAQARIAEQGHFTERFSRATEQLGNLALPVRLGGIYALWRLAEDSSLRDLISVIDVLCAFVRDPPHPPVDRPEPDTREGGPAAAKDEAKATDKLRADVQAILDLIGDRDALYCARLPDSHYLDLTGADLTNAALLRANLTNADLAEASLTNAHLWEANLTDANFFGADLTDARLNNARLTDATLEYANLTEADLSDANFTNAILENANLTDAKVTDADLTGADLTNANNLTQEQLDAACISEGGEPPTLPEGLNPPQKVCAPR